MKLLSILLIIVLFIYACSSEIKHKEQNSPETNYEVKSNIYLDDFEPSSFTYSDFNKLQDIANKVPERFDSIPNAIAYRLTSQDTNNVDFFCMWIDMKEVFPLGVFEKRVNNVVTVFYVTFSKHGDILDYLVFIRAKIGMDNGKIKWKLLSDVTFLFCEDCIPETMEYFAVKTLDTTEEALHPHVAKVLKTDKWYINENGKFCKREE